MSYIGNTQQNQSFVPQVDFFSGNGVTTAFTLSRTPQSVYTLEVVVANVVQNPSDAYTLSGNTITFTSAPPSGTNNIYVYYTSPNTQVVQPGQGTVGTTQLQSDLTLTNPTYTGTLTGGTGVVNIGSGQVYKDSSGNVGIGVSSPQRKLQVTGAAGGNGQILVATNGAFAGTDTATIGLRVYQNANENHNAQTQIEAVGTSNYSAALTFKTAPGGGDNNAAVERMRIDSSGNLLVGTTNSSYSSGVGIRSIPSASTNTLAVTGTDTTNATAGIRLYSTGVTNDRFYVTYAGYIYATQTTVQAITSDRNLKKDIVDYDKGLAEVCAMKPRYFRYKNDDVELNTGFIAQEMEEALPGSMVDAINGVDKTYKIDWYPILVKAIQELKAEVDDLKAQLEAK